MKRQRNWSSILLWAIYLALLAVLLPHTAWAFGRLESPEKGWLNVPWGMATAWAAAFAFEAAIAALTHCEASLRSIPSKVEGSDRRELGKLAKHLETTPRYTAGRVWLRRISHQYLNAYAAGLLVAVGVSVLANSGRAVEFGRDFARPAHTVPAPCRWGRYCVFGRYKIPRLLYSLASCLLFRSCFLASWPIRPMIRLERTPS